jgi:D-alanine-D-alanine ligase
LRVVLLVDDSLFDPDDPNFVQEPSKPWEAEFSVSHALRRLGHKVAGVPATIDIADTIYKIKAAKPDLVFNMVEEIGGQRQYDNLLLQILELTNIPYTGACPDALILSRNKQLAKLVVASAGIQVPKGTVISTQDFPLDDIRFPVILKPLSLDGSEGVTSRSYVVNRSILRRRVSQFLRVFPQGLLCEEYIPGRELIVTVSGATSVTIDSICELVFPETSRFQFATARAKFDKRYRERVGITYKTPAVLDAHTKDGVSAAAKTVYRSLRIKAYAKVEFRVNGDRIVFIEANPNSQLSRFANSTDFSSIGYERFINKILRMALNRRRFV